MLQLDKTALAYRTPCGNKVHEDMFGKLKAKSDIIIYRLAINISLLRWIY